MILLVQSVALSKAHHCVDGYVDKSNESTSLLFSTNTSHWPSRYMIQCWTSWKIFSLRKNETIVVGLFFDHSHCVQWSRQPILLRYRNIVSSHGHRVSDPVLSEGYLDVRVSRSTSTNVFTTTIYRKPTFTGIMNDWNSFVSFSYKKASVVSMIQRALSVCSTYSSLDIELDEVRYYSHLNG